MTQRDIRIALSQLLEAAIQCLGNARAAHRRLLLQLLEVLEEVLEVVDLVVADIAQQLAQNRLVAEFAQGVIVGRGAGLHHAARHHFQARVGVELLHGAQLRIFGEKAVVGLLPGKLRPHGFHIGP